MSRSASVPPEESGRRGARRLTRRRFVLATVALAGGGLALSWAQRGRDSLAVSPDTLEPNAFLQITPDGRFVFQLDKVEMGQGTMTGLLTLVAEELDVDPRRFTVHFAPVLGTFKRPMMMTGQSRSMADSWDVLRETGATARAMLLDAAAAEWGLPAAELETDDGRIRHPGSGREGAYREFVAAAARRSLPWSVELKTPDRYRWIGTTVPRPDVMAKVTGQAVYGIDVQPAGTLTAVVARVPELGAVLAGFDTTKAREIPGVRGFVALAYGVAVVAEHFWAAHKAARLVELQWSPGPLAGLNDEGLLESHRAQFAREEPDYVRADGDSQAAIGSAERILEVEYAVPYVAHATMEPLNATVHIRQDSADLWVPSQTPDMAQNIVAEVAGLPRKNVSVHTTYIGGGFGRRVLWDYVLEAALVAREFPVPVKTVWTREDDIRHGYFRQQTLHRLRAGLSSTGEVRGWEHTQVATPTANVLMPPSVRTLLPEFLEPATRQRLGAWLTDASVDLVAAFQAREGAERLAYDIPDTRFVQFSHDPGIPVSIWRSVGNSYNAFVVESFIDELAHASGEDPLAYRRSRLSDPRHLAVLDRVASLAGWGACPQGHAQGVAFFESFGTTVAQVAEVSWANAPNGRERPAGLSAAGGKPVADKVPLADAVRIHRVSCVVDCGRAVTPDIVRQQMESGIVFGLTAALFGEINFRDGQVVQSNFHDYRLLRMKQVPDITVEVMPGSAEPSGVGEPGVPPVAPAVANAVFALTGQRLRTMPFQLSRTASVSASRLVSGSLQAVPLQT